MDTDHNTAAPSLKPADPHPQPDPIESTGTVEQFEPHTMRDPEPPHEVIQEQMSPALLPHNDKEEPVAPFPPARDPRSSDPSLNDEEEDLGRDHTVEPVPGALVPVPPHVHELPPLTPINDAASLEQRKLDLDKREADIAAKEKSAAEVHMSRLTPQAIDQSIIAEYTVRGTDAFANQANVTPEAARAMACITICTLVLRNGFPVIGYALADSPEEYDFDMGKKIARQRAKDQIWNLEHYLVWSKLMGL